MKSIIETLNFCANLAQTYRPFEFGIYLEIHPNTNKVITGETVDDLSRVVEGHRSQLATFITSYDGYLSPIERKALDHAQEMLFNIVNLLMVNSRSVKVTDLHSPIYHLHTGLINGVLVVNPASLLAYEKEKQSPALQGLANRLANSDIQNPTKAVAINKGAYQDKDGNQVFVYDMFSKPNYGGIVRFIRQADDDMDWLFERDFIQQYKPVNE